REHRVGHRRRLGTEGGSPRGEPRRAVIRCAPAGRLHGGRGPAVTSLFGRLLHAPWFWGLVGILLLLVVNTVKDPAYLAVSVNPTTGLLTGNILDILRVSAPIIMISLGMTFVIATEGID